ncbi:Oidioi.mRNA.OKI2018_I69.PAR.g8504.t1.cds [Oikopleura dioica]|uniref:Oidioi.mRNA.OKI2018_I69.PAR.g8504.t1.cds n=1 Tax=Oikopleura dioica TaxID=34765 RepID=A0ABN7RKJ3_OIKDI|nr:Oidioi.mRNA.OKI2018_I69.PAR.g8504.t1.cds [Oikopleura dioica]
MKGLVIFVGGLADVLAQEDPNCLQHQLDEHCLEQTGFPYLRYNRAKGKWRCYGSLAPDGSMHRECTDNFGNRIDCVRHADDSPFLGGVHAYVLDALTMGCQVDEYDEYDQTSTTEGTVTTTVITTTADTTTSYVEPSTDEPMSENQLPEAR